MSNRQPASFKTAVILGLLYALCVMDRQIVAMLLEPIKHDMALSDTQLALMSGFVFALFYGVMGIPIARLASHTNRVKILSWSIGVWSLMTALSGMASNFAMLLLARIGVGVGEAGCQPAGQSLIADTYDEARRARALALFSAGAPIGGLAAFMLGGLLADTYGWRFTLIAASVPGLLFAIAIRFLIKEVPRTSIKCKQKPLASELKSLIATNAYRYALVGHIFCVALMYVVMIWVPALMARSFDMSLTQIGMMLGTVAILGGLSGSIISGILSDKLAAKNLAWLGRLPMLCCVMAMPVYMLAIWTDNMWVLMGSLAAVMMLLNAHTPPTYATYHKVVQPQNRAMAVALSTLTVNIIGLGLAPLLIGVISDHLATEYGNSSLKIAMVTGVIFLPMGAYCYSKVVNTLQQESSDNLNSTTTATSPNA